jgi:predicted DNA-binding transcriptional regulator AlpA
MSNLLDLTKKIPILKVEISAAELLETVRNVTNETIERYEQQRQQQQPDRLLTRKQAAARLMVNETTIWRHVKRGYLSPVEVGGKRFFKQTQLDSILQKGANV